jgi:signal peptidase
MTATRPLVWANRAATAVLVLVLVVLAGGVGLRVAGLDALVDNTDSMRPAIAAGDVVLTRAARAADLRPGQIATIHDPLSGRLITHRVTATARDGARVVITTRGDANSASERWALAPGAAVRRVAARIPGAGRPVRWMSAPLLRLALAALGAGLLGAAVLRRIWSAA